MNVTQHAAAPTNATATKPVLRQRSVTAYWNNEKDPVNIRLGEVDGLYHHHYGIAALVPGDRS